MTGQEASPISEHHPIRPLFTDLTRRGLALANIRDDASVQYVSDLMTSFVSTEALYPVRDAAGNRLEHLHDLVVAAHNEAEPSLRRVRFRYLGDLTLFMLGLFPERFRRGRHALARDLYRVQGQSSYRTAAALAGISSELTVFRRLADEYDQYVEGLHHVRLYIRDPFFQYMFRQFGI
jgi:hypothetical protein